MQCSYLSAEINHEEAKLHTTPKDRVLLSISNEDDTIFQAVLSNIRSQTISQVDLRTSWKIIASSIYRTTVHLAAIL